MNTDTKPQIIIDLDPVLEGYCRWIFNSSGKNSPMKLNLDHKIGKHIYSHVRTSRRPSPRPTRINPVVFILPVTENNFYEFKNKHTHVNKLDEEQIICFVSSCFDSWCEQMFENGYFYNWQQDDIVDAILRGLNVRNNKINSDSVKKNDYRNRCKKEQKRFKMLVTHKFTTT